MIGGGTGITGHISIGDDIIITGFGMITRSLDKPGMYSSVIPVEEVRQWRRIVGRLERDDGLDGGARAGGGGGWGVPPPRGGRPHVSSYSSSSPCSSSPSSSGISSGAAASPQ